MNEMKFDETVTKGGVCWFEMTIRRGNRGLSFFIKADPRIEDFFKGLGNGTDQLDAYSKDWFSTDSDREIIEVYRMDKKLSNVGYSLAKPASDLKTISPDGTQIVNLAFLRFKGVGEGIRFGVVGPFSRQYINELKFLILTEIRNLIKDYVAPVNINLRVSSTEI